ncbi:MAG: amidophosphoribosyltransferase [Marinilabiliales bacterium]|nr:MAG: amidophosphoribosyltransferase [Marinilabiliales bacterium]
MRIVTQYLTDLFNLFFPNLCLVCNSHLVNQEELICTKCLYNLPKTGYHQEIDNPVSQLFWGRTKIEYATAYFTFSKGSRYQDLMHKFKYHGSKEIGYVLGKAFGNHIRESVFNEVDVIVPVPLHKSKLKKRGYNQSEWIGMGLSEALQVPLDIISFIRLVATETQTRKSRFERWKNVENIFSITNKEALTGKHILLVDDVVTTGSTLEACANVLLDLDNTKVSIATLAVA